MGLSAFASVCTTLKFFFDRRWGGGVVDRSCASFLFFLLFIDISIWCVARTAYYVWMSVTLRDESGTALPNHPLSIISRLGPQGVLRSDKADNGWVTALVCVGDVALFAIVVVSFPLAYELFRITAHAMDRGAALERKQIRIYRWVIHALLLVFAVVEGTLAIVFRGYTKYTRSCLVAVYALQATSLVYMLALLGALKRRGRQHESVHGVLVKSPIYSRLKGIFVGCDSPACADECSDNQCAPACVVSTRLVYCFFMFQFQVCSVVFFITSDHSSAMLWYIGVATLIYNATGLALSLVATCSQSCFLRASACCLPSDAEAQLYGRSVCGLSDPAANSPLPPAQDPVFVVTDIESSSALWGIGDGRLMQEATEIHDGILRARLSHCRGYEITTCGDSFQLAFHSIHDAVNFCFLVQLDLLAAPWPKQLHNVAAATRKQHAGVYRLIFRGLRVRMGIHDAALSDGELVCNTHAVTGKLTYTGASKLIADEISDIGSGGQILVTGRVADWLRAHDEVDNIHFTLARVREYSIPHIRAHLEIFQVLPRSLKARLRRFPSLRARQVGSLSMGRGGSSASVTAALLEWRVGVVGTTAIQREDTRRVEGSEHRVDFQDTPYPSGSCAAYAPLASPY
ncbi:hypothetical protein PybrP1_006483 [[Pythium] brassicae (nom. inval.)]|nr:hypothetical protein PybrP1_006483 [[Pythium] brassicae (nom. inval.)]